MSNRTRISGLSSLRAAAFQVVRVRDSRGLLYCMRKDIPTLGWLSRMPRVEPPRQPRGRPKLWRGLSCAASARPLRVGRLQHAQ